MQLSSKDTCSRFGTQGVLWEDRCACKTELVVPLELLPDVLLRLPELAAVALVKDENDVFAVDRQVTFAFHQVVELLDGGDDDFVVVLLQVAFESCGAVRAVDAVGRETLVLLHRLVVEVFAVDHKEYLVDEIQLGSQSRRFETGQSFARASGVPDEPTTFGFAPGLGSVGTVDLP